nr:hypothetical protein [Tanacetum cinerariifolium]
MGQIAEAFQERPLDKEQEPETITEVVEIPSFRVSLPTSYFLRDSDYLLEETDTLLSHFDNSSPEYETFSFDIKEKSSGSTTTHSDYSLPNYEDFYFDDDHIEENSSGSTTTHSDFSLLEYDSFIFDLSIDLFPPADRGAFYLEEFAYELAHIISPSEYDYFYFDLEVDPGEFTRVLKDNIFDLSTKGLTNPGPLLTHGKFRLLVRPLMIFTRSRLVDLIRFSLSDPGPEMTTSVENNLVFRSFFKKQKLTGPNFIDWYRQLRLLLLTEDKENYLEHPLPATPVALLGQRVPLEALATHAAWVKVQKEVSVLMLLTMYLEIQRNLAHLGAYDMLQELKALYSKRAEQELLQTVREFHTCKQKEGQSVSSHFLKIKGYIDNLERLGQPVGQNLAVSLILVSLNKDFDSFMQNYNMHGMGKTMNELHAMLKLHEETLLKKDDNPALHAIRAGRVQKNQKNKPHKAAKGVMVKVKTRWDMHLTMHHLILNIRLLHHLRKITLQRMPFATNVVKLGSGEGTGLRGSKKLKPGALSLYVGDSHRAVVEAIGTYHLELPNGLVIVLNNCHYAPFITRGVILVSYLFDDGFINRFDDNNVISVLKNNLVYFMAVPWDGKCISCMSGKMARKPYSHQVERAKDLLGLIHTDVCGPFKIVSRQGASYFVTFTDNFSHYGYVYLLKHKHEVFETFKEHGIITHRTLPYTPQNNRVSERRNQTLLDMARSMMSQTTLPKSFWDYALETVARILNMIPTKKGCEAFVKRYTLTKPDKLDPRSFKCIFVGYPKETMGYSFYSPSENKVFVAQNAEFFESKLLDLKASGSMEDLELIQEEDTNPSVDTSLNHKEDDQEIDEPQSDINPIRKSSRTRRPLDRMCLYIDAEERELEDLGEPANYKVALLNLESKKWLDVMNVEMKSMKDNDVWVLVEIPPNARTVGSKWLFKKKTDMDGAVYIFKARLIAKGFTQTYGVDYEETFSPIADIRAIRILIAIVAYYDYEIWQMDVKTAFLNGHLFEEVYMEQPEGFVNPKYPNHVCKLKRSIYGLKQSSRQWNKRFDDEIKKFGFTQNPDEPCVYLKASKSYIVILILYVDDILLMENNIPMLQDVKSYLGRSFAMKDLEGAAYIFGIKIYRDRTKRLIGLYQRAYIEKILKRYYMENSRRRTIPMQEKLKLCKSQGASTPAEKQRNMKRELRASCYTDVGYLTDADNLKSQTGYVFIINGVWIRKFIFGLGIVPTIEEPISMYCDNTGALAIAKDDGVTKGARHFRAKVHYLRDTIKLGDVKIEKIDIDDN